jgi:hypothetical protein
MVVLYWQNNVVAVAKTKLNEEKAAIPAKGEEETRAWSG